MLIFIPSMPKSIKPLDKIILKLEKPLTDTIKLGGGLELYLDPSWHPEQHVTVTGEVVGLPDNHPFGDDLNIKDIVCFSYQVVADREFDDEPCNFHPRVNEENLKIFYNALGEKIQIRAVQGAIAKRFVCVHWDKYGEFDFGYEGTFGEVERWLTQFKFGNVQRYKFVNCIELDGQLFWKADYDQIFAKKVGKKLICLGDRLILNPIKIDRKDKIFNGIELPESIKGITLAAAARVESAPKETGLKKGDKVGFDSISAERYQFYGKDYILLNKERIQGVWQN